MALKHFSPTHRCFAPNCQKDVMNKHLMCYHHWKRVPLALQGKIVEAWRDGLRHHLHPTYEYQEAIKEARTLLQEQDDRKLAKQPAPMLAGGAA